MKKWYAIFLILFLMSGCRTKGEPIELSAREVVEKLQDPKQNSFLLYLTTDLCYTCDEYEKIIMELEEEEAFEIYYLHIDLEEENESTIKSLEELRVTTGDISSLPTTYYFYQGTLLTENKKDGYLEKKDLKTWLENLHILH